MFIVSTSHFLLNIVTVKPHLPIKFKAYLITENAITNLMHVVQYKYNNYTSCCSLHELRRRRQMYLRYKRLRQDPSVRNRRPSLSNLKAKQSIDHIYTTSECGPPPPGGGGLQEDYYKSCLCCPSYRQEDIFKLLRLRCICFCKLISFSV